jgi:hypothetical protein
VSRKIEPAEALLPLKKSTLADGAGMIISSGLKLRPSQGLKGLEDDRRS